MMNVVQGVQMMEHIFLCHNHVGFNSLQNLNLLIPSREKSLSETLNQLKRPLLLLVGVSAHVGWVWSMMKVLMEGLMQQVGNLIKDGIFDLMIADLIDNFQI